MVEPELIGGRTPVGPSAIAAPREGAATPEALTAEEVEAMVTKFGEATRRAIKAGFDGVEIGANTYLIQQFFSPNSNQRDDQWGGSRENRARFPLAVKAGNHPENGSPVCRSILHHRLSFLSGRAGSAGYPF